MIYKLNKSEFHILENLITGVKNFPEVHAVINCINPGEIYVDDNKKPTSALVWNQGMQGHYFVGESNNKKFNDDIKDYVNNTITKALLNKGIGWFEVSGVDNRWEYVIEDLFKDRGIKYEYQYVYRMTKKPSDLTKDSSKYGYSINKLTKDVLESNISNLDYITNELELFWGTMENFFDKGICYYAMVKNKIVSICYSGFMANGVYTIGIETQSDYRKKGYAYELALEFIEECKNISISPYWDCSKDNMGSIRLAEKLGFEKDSEYRCYWFNI